jgi:phage gpG-like protein
MPNSAEEAKAGQVLASVGGGRRKDFYFRLRQKLAHPPPDLLANIGKLIVATSQQAFDDQGLGEFKWAPRYPRQSSPKVNIAGIVEDFRKGVNPPVRRFEDRPALVDVGTLSGRLTYRVIDDLTVEAGSYLPYAGVHQHGGESRQTIDATVRANLATWLKTKRRSHKRKVRKGERESGQEPFSKKLGFLFREDELVTQIGARPFVGITPELQVDIRRTIERDIPK